MVRRQCQQILQETRKFKLVINFLLEVSFSGKFSYGIVTFNIYTRFEPYSIVQFYFIYYVCAGMS